MYQTIQISREVTTKDAINPINCFAATQRKTAAVTIIACRWRTVVCGTSQTKATGHKALLLPLYRPVEPGFGCFTSATLCCSSQNGRMLTAEFPRICPMTFPSTVIVFHRIRDEWEVGSELPFLGGIRDTQPVSIILSYVQPELELQNRRRLLHHRHIHHLHVRSRWGGCRIHW